MNLMTLTGLEAIAEKEYEKQADEWVRALAKREGLDVEMLRPHLIAAYHMPNVKTDLTFRFPGHSVIRLASDDRDGKEYVAHIEGGKLVGPYTWYAYRVNCVGSASFHGCEGLGHALLVARWAHDHDERAEWV